MIKKLRVGIVGAGYISEWHADAIGATAGVDLACVVDRDIVKAKSFGNSQDIPYYETVRDMIAANAADAVHILTPPESHFAVTRQCIAAGLHVLVEKPVALSSAEVALLCEAARDRDVKFAAGHNFLGSSSHMRLKSAVVSGELGRISTSEIHWCLPLGPLRAGPYGLWLMRETRNLLLELGPHVYAFMQDLFGDIEILHLQTSNDIALPGGGVRPQCWRILARAGKVDVVLTLSLVETHDDRSVTVRGSSGVARLDYAQDTLVVTRANCSDLVLNPLRNALGQSFSHLREGTLNAGRQIVSLNKRSPYGLSFRGMCEEFYKAIFEGRPVDARFSGSSAIKVMRAIEDTLDRLPEKPRAVKSRRKAAPTALVIGGTGFIGRALTRRLVAKGTHVRVLTRGKTSPFDDIPESVETVNASLQDARALEAAMDGIRDVYHLAKSEDKTWTDALENDVAVTERIAAAARATGVARLVYTGTIASYDWSDPGVTITEKTGFGASMQDRNIYARSKAECEARLMAMYREKGLPVSIARPGIVVGAGGPLQHWGIGRWHGSGAVKLWGNGRNLLPFVLVDDVAEGLILIAERDEAVGESFNLIGDPMLSARDYFDEIHATLGARINVSGSTPVAHYVSDAMKFFLKTTVLRKADIPRPSLRDWKSRAHLSAFSNEKSKSVLGWNPVSQRDVFVKSAISDACLFGL